MPDATSRFVDVLVDDNPSCAGVQLRFKKEDEPREVHAVRHFGDDDRPRDCDVSGWSSEGGGSPVAAWGVTVEDSGSGVAVLIYGGDWGLRLIPRDGGDPFGEAYLRVSPEDVLA